MEIRDYAYIPLLVLSDDEPVHVNHTGLASIGWSHGLMGHWSRDWLIEIQVFLEGVELSFVLTSTKRMESLLMKEGEISDTDIKYVAGIIMTMLPEEFGWYSELIENGFKFRISRKVKLCMKVTETGVNYVVARQ